MSRTVIIIIVVLVITAIVLLVIYFMSGDDTPNYIPMVTSPPPSTTRKRPLLIREAKYGCDVATCVKMDVTTILQGYVEDDALLIPPSVDGQHYNKIFGRDPAPNVRKTLEIQYTAGGVEKFIQVEDSSGLSLNID